MYLFLNDLSASNSSFFKLSLILMYVLNISQSVLIHLQLNIPNHKIGCLICCLIDTSLWEVWLVDYQTDTGSMMSSAVCWCCTAIFIIIAVCVSAKPLHTSCATEEGSHVYLHTANTTGHFVWIWICSAAIPQDGVPCAYSTLNAH